MVPSIYLELLNVSKSFEKQTKIIIKILQHIPTIIVMRYDGFPFPSTKSKTKILPQFGHNFPMYFPLPISQP